MNTQGMNKEAYLRQLKTHLARLSQSEQDDILRDQEELIRDAVASGRSEEEFIASLGDPKSFAASLVAESRIQMLEQSTSLNSAVKNSWRAVIAVIALAPFNLIFVLGPFLALVGVLIGFWTTSVVGVVVSLVAALIYFAEGLKIGVEPAIHLSSFFMIMGTLFLFLCFSGATAWVTKLFAKISVRYLKWNLKLVQQAGE